MRGNTMDDYEKVWNYNEHSKRVQCDFIPAGSVIYRKHPNTGHTLTFNASKALFEFEWLLAKLWKPNTPADVYFRGKK